MTDDVNRPASSHVPGSEEVPEVERRARDRNAEGKPENARPRDAYGAPLPRDAEDQLPGRVEPEDVCETVEQAHDRAVELFDAERFFEAHEFFEWAWKGPVTPDEDRPFYKGLAQVAVGLTHTQRRNAPGARSLLERGIGAVGAFAPTHRGVDVATLVERATAFADRLESDPGFLGPDVAFPRFPTT